MTIKRVSEQAASYNKTTNNYRKYHFESTLNYDRLFGKDHRVSGLVYYYMSDDKYSSESVSKSVQRKRKGFMGNWGKEIE